MPTQTDSIVDLPWLKHQRLLLGMAAVIYLAWWFTVEGLLNHAFNPLGSRLFVCGLLLAILGGSYHSIWIRKHISVLYALAVTVLTLHFFYLFNGNPGDPNWVLGSYITVLAVGMTFDRAHYLWFYVPVVLAATSFLVWQGVAAPLVLPGMITILVILLIILVLRRRAESERQRRIKAETERESVEAVSRAKSLFLANVSHELRTPLTSIIGFAQLLEQDETLGEDNALCIGRVNANAQKLLETVEQILTLTEDDLAGIKTTRVAFDLQETIEKKFAELRPLAVLKGLTMTLTAADNYPPLVVGDQASVQRIFGNLLSNAIKFTPAGSIEVLVATQRLPASDAGLLSIHVRDTGLGIIEDERTLIFDPFRQVQESYTREQGGTGIGLTVARKLARRLGGDVVLLQSDKTKGSTFLMTTRYELHF